MRFSINIPTHDSKSIKVLIVDDMVQVRQELCQLLQLTDGIDIIGEASDGQEAILQAERLRPDVVIMDLEMPILDGLQATRQIKQRRLANRVVQVLMPSSKKAVLIQH
jgi:DNA-binding NarL/FixJ family response regulator